MAKRSMLREPLLHFLVLGALTSGAWAVLAPRDAGAQLGELDARVRDGAGAGAEARLQEELLVREGRRLGLDRDDPIVRRRIAQRMRYLYEDLGEREPSDEELAQLAAQVPERAAQVGARRRFEQRALGSAKEQKSHPTTASSIVGPASRSRVEARWGTAFAKTVFSCPVGEWCEVETARGRHAVRVIEELEPRPLAGSAHQAELRARWTGEQREAQFERELAKLRARYGLETSER